MEWATPARWSRVGIAGKPADVFEPLNPRQEAAIIFLHGHGLKTLAGNSVYTRLLEEYGLRVVCPSGGQAWWLDSVCQDYDAAVSPEQHVVGQVLPWMMSRWNLPPRQVALFGVSMGGQGAVRIAYRHALKFPVVAALSPMVDLNAFYGHGLPLDRIFPDAEAARQASATLQIHPLNWPKHQWLSCDPIDKPAFEGLIRLMSKLSSSGIPFDGDRETSHGGHTWDYFNFMAPRAIAWMAEKLKYESLRA